MATLRELQERLAHTPVIAELHPLAPLCLGPSIRIVDNALAYLAELDDVAQCSLENVIITEKHHLLLHRFPVMKVEELPSATEVNQAMHYHLDYIRQKLLTSRKIAAYIEAEVGKQQHDAIIVLLIDGLSYQDVNGWKESMQPCFIDGPTITFAADEEHHVVENVGFPAIINQPTIFSRLQGLGFNAAYGYTYWSGDSNTVSDNIFRGVPTFRVDNFNVILRKLETLSPRKRVYIQIIRQGLDGLAHHRRELSREEIEEAIASIYQDAQALLVTLKNRGYHPRLYLTADHGILWKEDHNFQHLELPLCGHPRYTERILSESEKQYAVRMTCGEKNYSLFRYPYLASKIQADARGVHGGLSYEESIVPFVQMEA